MFSLGLGLPIHRIPIMTILLAIFCTWKYISIDVSNNKKFEKKHQQIAKKINQSQELISLKREYCQQYPETKVNCISFGKGLPIPSKINKRSYLLEEQKLKNQFISHLKNKSNKITSLSSYQNFDDLNSSLQRELIPWYQEIHLLSFENQNLKSYLNSMFTHSGAAHLFGNMMALIVFGIYVEAKVGALIMLSSFVITGLVSFYVFINHFSAPFIPLVGASGAISGILGIFYLSFFQHYLKFWLYFKTFLLPVKYFFPIFYVVGDVVTHIEATTNVASMAHISGLLSGMILVLLIPQIFKTPHPFIYHEELNFYKVIQNKKFELSMVDQFNYWLRRNPINFIIREKLITELWKKEPTKDYINNKYYETLRENTKRFIGRSLKYNKGTSLLKTIDLISLKYPLSLFLTDFKTDEIIKIYNYCLKKNAYLSATRLACVLLDKKISQSLTNTLISNIESITSILNPDDLVTVLNQCSHFETDRIIKDLRSQKKQEIA
jgi:membrane associated rhomboid family serine protease